MPDNRGNKGYLMTVLILIVALTLLISFTCSLSEATLYSSRMSALEVAKAAGRHAGLAERLIEMKRNIAVPISAIVILDTVTDTAGATVAGMYVAEAAGVLVGSLIHGFVHGKCSLVW